MPEKVGSVLQTVEGFRHKSELFGFYSISNADGDSGNL